LTGTTLGVVGGTGIDAPGVGLDSIGAGATGIFPGSETPVPESGFVTGAIGIPVPVAGAGFAPLFVVWLLVTGVTGTVGAGVVSTERIVVQAVSADTRAKLVMSGRVFIENDQCAWSISRLNIKSTNTSWRFAHLGFTF
jgi:hypothetical protein